MLAQDEGGSGIVDLFRRPEMKNSEGLTYGTG